MSDVTEITEEGTVQLEIIEVSGGTIEVVGEDKTTIEIVESTSTTSDLDITTQTNTVVVESNASEGTSINVSEDSPTIIEIGSPNVSVDIIDKILISGTSELSFNNLLDKPFTFDSANQRATIDNLVVNDTASFTGKIGVGTSSPDSALHISGSGNDTSGMRLRVATSDTSFTSRSLIETAIKDSSGVGHYTNIGVYPESTTGTTVGLSLRNRGLLASSQPTMSIESRNADGNILIIPGASVTKATTFSSSGDVTILGNIKATTGELDGNLNFNGDNNHIFFGNQNTFVGELSNSNKLELRGGGSTGNETIYINSSGNLGIGKSTPTEKLEVVGNVSASGLLFVSVSEATNGQHNQVVLYDTASGRFYYTGSFGGGGSATIDLVTSSISESLIFDGNRFITRQEAGEFAEDRRTPILNLGTSGSVLEFLEAYFFPNEKPIINNGHLNGTVDPIREFTPSGSVVLALDVYDPEVNLDIQTLSYSTSSTYTADKFRIDSVGRISLNTLATESLNTDENNFYEGELAHKFPVKIQDSFGGIVEEDIYFRISPNQLPIFRDGFGGVDITNGTKTLVLYETSSFSGSKPAGRIFFEDPDEDIVTINTGSLPAQFNNDFDLIINFNNIELSQSVNLLDASNSPYTFHLTASDEHYVAGQDNESRSFLTYIIEVVDNIDPAIVSTQFNINEKTPDNFQISDFINDGVLIDPDENETNLTTTNFTLIGAFSASSPTVSGSNLTGSFTGTSLLDPTTDPFYVGSNTLKRSPNVFLNQDLINLYKYSLTAQSSLTGVTGSSGVISIVVDNHIQENNLHPNSSTGYIIESSISPTKISTDPSGILGSILGINGTNQIFQNWIVTSSQDDLFEGITYGDPGTHFTGATTDLTGSQIHIRLKNNISGSGLTSGSIVTCSITASQDDFPTTKQFFEIPIEVTKNNSPILSKTDNTDNWFNTVALANIPLVTINASDPEGDALNNDSFQLIGNSSEHLSASYDTQGNFFVRANTTLRNTSQYPTFSFTASLSDIHNFRTSSISGAITLNSPEIIGNVVSNNTVTSLFEFFMIETAVEGDKVVKESNGQSVSSNTQGSIGIDFTNFTGGANNSINSITIDNDILAISSPGGLLSKGPTSIPSNLNVGDIITASITIEDIFQNTITNHVSVSIAQNFPPTFESSSESNLTSSLPEGTVIASVFEINDAESEPVTISAFREDNDNEQLKVTTSNTTASVFLKSPIEASSSPITLSIAITASDNQIKTTNSTSEKHSLITVPIAANTVPTLTVTNTVGDHIAPKNAGFVIATVTTSSTDGDPVTVSLVDDDLSIHQVGNSYEVRLKNPILGNFNSDTVFSASVTASDGLYTVNEDVRFIISGNQAPTYDLTPSESLVFPIPLGQTLATITNISDDLGDSVTTTVTSPDVPGGLVIDGTGATRLIKTTQIINSGSNRTYNIGVTGSDSYSNLRKTNTTVTILKNEDPEIGDITLVPNLKAPVASTTSILSFTYLDPASEDVDLTIGDSNFIITDNEDGTAQIAFDNNGDGVPGTSLKTTTLTGSITASDGFNSVFKSFTTTILGNSAPTFTFTPSEGLIQTLSANQNLGTITYSDADDEVVTFITSSDVIYLADLVAGSSKQVLLTNSTTSPNAETITFSVTASDSNGNSTDQQLSVNVSANSAPTFTSSSVQPFFRAGDYAQSASVIQISDVVDPQGAPVTISINENDTEFFLDNASGEGFRVKVKNEISGTVQELTTHSGSITASNGVTQTVSSFTESIQPNIPPIFSVVNSTVNLVVPVSSGSTVATITGVTDEQSFNSGQTTFNNDTPFTASLLIPAIDEVEISSDAVASYITITASAASTSGSGTDLVTQAQDVVTSSIGNPAVNSGKNDSNFDQSLNKSWQSRYITASHFYAFKNGGIYNYPPAGAFRNSKSWLIVNLGNVTKNPLNLSATLDFDFGTYLGRNPIITQIDITQSNWRHNRYQISGSNNGSEWTPLHQEESGLGSADQNRTITFANSNAYKFYRISADRDNCSSAHGPGLQRTVFYESPAPDADLGVIVPYVIESQSIGDTTNWNINYNGTSDITTPQNIFFDVEISDKHGNTDSKLVDLTYTANNPPSFNISTASFVSPTDTIDSPISQSQIIATIDDITDIDFDDPYTCSVFTDGEYSNPSPNFVASVITEGDTNSFNISCSTTLSEPVNTTLDLFIKVEDNFGSFTSAQISYNIIGDNDTPVIPSDQHFTIEEHEPVRTIVGTITATDNHTLTFTTASTYTAGHFGIGNPNTGEITASQVPTANLNTSESSDGTFRHPVVIKVTDQHGAFNTNTVFIRVNPNQAPNFSEPTKSFGEFEEFLPINTEIGQVSATDPENGTITYRTASSYSTTAVSCSTEGVLFFNAISTESMHNNSNSHSVSIEAVDQHGNVGSQSIHFTIDPNLPPTWHKGGTGGTEVANETTESISEDLTNATASIFYYNDPNGDALTITFTTASYWNGVLKIVDVPASQKVEIRQIGDIEFDTQPVFDFVLSASDNHFVGNGGLDPASQTVRSLRLKVEEEANPTFNFNQHTTINENSTNSTLDVGTIESNATSFTVTHFELIGSYLVSDILNPTLGTNLTNSYSDPLGTDYLTNPASDPFEQYGGSSSPEVRKKSNVKFNSDIINYYQYSASILSSSGNTNSGIISIPIEDHDPGTILFPDDFFIIESAINGEFIVNSDVGYNDGSNNNSQVDFAATDLVDSQVDNWSFTLTSSNNLIKNTNITPGTSLTFQLQDNLSGSALKFGNTIDINFTASLVDFPSTKLSQSISATIISNSAPTLTVVENTDNWNDISAVNGTSLVTLTVVPDVENDWANTTLNGTSFTLTDSPHLTMSFVDGNTISITPSSSLSVASSPYKYTASIKDVHGFRSSSVVGEIAITFGDTGSLTSGSEFMYVLDTAIVGDKVVNNDHGIGIGPLVGTQASLGVNYPSSDQEVDFNTMTAANGLFNISSTGLLSVASNITSSAEVIAGELVIDTEIHFSSTIGTPGTGSISVTIVDNIAPTITFGSAISDLQFGDITTSTILREFTVTDPEGLSFNNPTITNINNSLSLSDLTITSLGDGINYRITPSSNITNLTTLPTINFTVQVVDSFGKIGTQASSITIDNAEATPGTLKLAYSDLDVTADNTFYILDTATASLGTYTTNANPMSISDLPPNSSSVFESAHYGRDGVAEYGAVNLFDDGINAASGLPPVSPYDDISDYRWLLYRGNGSQTLNATQGDGRHLRRGWKYFNNIDTSDLSVAEDSALYDNDQWVIYDFGAGNEKVIGKVRATWRFNNKRRNLHVELSGSNTHPFPDIDSGDTTGVENLGVFEGIGTCWNTTAIEIETTGNDLDNTTPYRFYKVTFKADGFNAESTSANNNEVIFAMDELEFFERTLVGGTENIDPVITGSSGIPNSLKAAVFSASFDGTTEDNPTPTFTISDTTNFNIRNAGGLGYLEVTENFNLGSGATYPTIEISTPGTTDNPSSTPIQINVVLNNGPTSDGIITTNISLDSYTNGDLLGQIVLVDDGEGDFPISATVSNQIYNGVSGDYINAIGDRNTPGNMFIFGNANLFNDVGGDLTFDVTLTDSKEKTLSLNNNTLSVTGPTPLPTPTLIQNGAPFIIETADVDNASERKLKITGGTNYSMTVQFDGASVADTPSVSSTSFEIISPDYLTIVATSQVELTSILESNGISHINSPVSVVVQITTNPSNTALHDSVTTNRSFDLIITENFPPTASAFSQTVGGNMTASLLTPSDTVFTISGIHDPEEDLGYTITIDNELSTNGVASPLLNIDAGITGHGPGTSGSIAIKPTQAVCDEQTGQTITFSFTLTDGEGSSRTYTGNTITIASPEVEEVIEYGKIYIYESSEDVNNLSSTSGYNNATLGWQGASNVPPIPSVVTAVGGSTFGEYYVYPNFVNGELGNSSFNTGFGNPVILRHEITLTEETDLNLELQKMGVISMGGSSAQTLICVPSSSHITGLPTVMQDGESGGSATHKLGMSVNPVSTTFNASTGEDAFDFGLSTQNAEVHVITLDNAHEGYSNWYIIGLKGGIAVDTTEIRVQPI